MSEFDLIRSDSVSDFINQVNRALRQGWTLQGGPFLSNGGQLSQAIVR